MTFSLRLLCAALLPLLVLVETPAQPTSNGRPIHFLWSARKAPFPIPKPAWLADTSYSATDTTRNPWLVVYNPTVTANGAAVILIPGGGYTGLSGWPSEGPPNANKLAGYGITVFMLHYRVSPFRYPVPMWDVQRAVRWVRAHAAQYGIDKRRVGVLGFSAGGHVASTVATHYDAGLTDPTSAHWYPGAHDSIDLESCRPDFQALVYPMTTMVRYLPGTTTEYAYGPGRTAYLGSSPSNALVDSTSNEKNITPDTPPAWINWGTNDQLVHTRNSTAYRDSLLAKGVKVKTVIVAGGGHSASTARIDSLRTWLDTEGWLSPVSIRARAGSRAVAVPEAAREVDLRGRAGNPVGLPLALPATRP
jgi:acetyl esterase/lipase